MGKQNKNQTKSTETQTQSKMDLFQNSLASAFSTAQITVEPKYQGQDRVADFYGRLWTSIVDSQAYMQSGLQYPGTVGTAMPDMAELYRGCIKDEHELLKSMWDAAFTAFLDGDYDHFGVFAKSAHGLEDSLMTGCMVDDYHVSLISSIDNYFSYNQTGPNEMGNGDDADEFYK